MSDLQGHERRCGSCNGPLEADARFCGACGALRSTGALGHPQEKRSPGVRGKGRNVRRWFWGVGVILPIALLASLASLRVWSEPPSEGTGPFDWAEHDLPDPKTVPLSPVDEHDAVATRRFLKGDGTALLDFHDVSLRLLELPVEHGQETAERCKDLVESSIDPITPHPTHLLALSAEIPDRATASIWRNDIAAKWDLLSACLKEADPDRLRRHQVEAAFNHLLVERRLVQLELGADVEVER